MKKLITLTSILSILVFASEASPRTVTTDGLLNEHSQSIAKMLHVIKPQINNKKKDELAVHLYNTSKEFKIDPKIMIAIIDTESDFDNTKVSTTGDLSLAQINTAIWNKELKRMKLPEIDSKKLAKDEKYALAQMAMILSILKVRHSVKDKNWFARYHSHTKKLKKLYSLKVESRMRKIASIN